MLIPKEFRIPRNTNCIKLISGHYVPTQGMPKIEEVIIETNISLPYLIQDKVIGYFNLRKNYETFYSKRRKSLEILHRQSRILQT